MLTIEEEQRLLTHAEALEILVREAKERRTIVHKLNIELTQPSDWLTRARKLVGDE
jgi:lipoate-protein ligase A